MTTLSDLQFASRKQYEAEQIFLIKHAEILSAILEDIAPLEPVRVCCDCGEINISIAGDRTKLARLFRVFRRRGLVPSHRPSADEDTQYAAFWGEKGKPPILWLVFNSTQCRRVQIGNKLVEVPVYETVCDEVASQ